MADPVLFKNAYLALGTSTASYVNFSGALKTLGFPLSKAELANSVMGDVAETFEQGLESLQISATLRQDFTTGNGVDGKFYGYWKNGTKLYALFKPVNTTTAATNPEFRCRVKVFSVTPISGSHGELLANEVSMRLLSATSTASAYNGITRSASS